MRLRSPRFHAAKRVAQEVRSFAPSVPSDNYFSRGDEVVDARHRGGPLPRPMKFFCYYSPASAEYLRIVPPPPTTQNWESTPHRPESHCPLSVGRSDQLLPSQ